MNNNQSEESTLRQRLCFIFRFFTLRIINPESHLNPRYHKYDVIPVNCDSSSVRDSFHRLASLSHKGKESFSTPTPRNTMQQISRRKTEHVFTRRARTVVIEAQRERGMGNVSFSRCILIVLWSVISKPACCFFRPLVPIKSQHGSPKSARHYPHLVAPRKNSADEASWILNVLRGTWEILTERGQRWRSAHHWLHSTCHRPTSRRITWNPNWFFFFLIPLKRARRKTSNIWWPSVMGCVTRMSKGGAE